MAVERPTNSESVEETLERYLALGTRFEKPPVVTLQLMPQKPHGEGDPVSAVDIAASTAIQCYAPGVAALKPRPDARSQVIANSTLDAGHHTTRMHVNYTWQMVGVSRSVVHDIFHANPFYHSEQQSQRYVEAKAGNFVVPTDLTDVQKGLYVEAANQMNAAYFELLGLLHPAVEVRVRQMYPEQGWKVEDTAKRLNDKINKLCQEVARYVLPIGQFTTLYHTLNEIQLLRLFRASQMQNFPDEARYIIGQMIKAVAENDPSIMQELRKPITSPIQFPADEKYLTEWKAEFDSLLTGKLSLLLSIPDIRSQLITAARNSLGIPLSQKTNDQVLALLADPKLNPLLADVYEIGMFDPLTSCLRQASVTFATRLSHTADSQRQRQRRTPGATPSVSYLYDGKPDYMTPLVIQKNLDLQSRYDSIMVTIYSQIDKCIEAGIPRETALLLLPNAHAVRVVESGDLFDWLHRFKQRLCYLAQEEIFFISLEQVDQITQAIPEMAQALLAPCSLRRASGVTPRCPEGTRWCGQPVYNFPTIADYQQHRLI